VITFDPRSHGRSTVTSHGNDYATQGDDLYKLIDTLNLKDVIVAGWPTGCLTIWEYIKQHGTKNIRAAVCIDLSPKLLSDNKEDWVKGSSEELGEVHNSLLQSPQGHRDFVKMYATEVMVERDLADDELQWIVEQSLQTPYHIASKYFECAILSDYREEAKQMSEKLPSLYIIAKHWSETAVKYLSTHYPKIKTEVLGGHMMFWEHADAFNALVERFIKGL